MTITFTAVPYPIVGHAISCNCPDAIAQAHRYSTYADAISDLETIAQVNTGRATRTPLPGCDRPDFCVLLPLTVHALENPEDAEAPSMSVSEADAAVLLRTLGYSDVDKPGGLVGAATVTLVRGRVNLALKIMPYDQGDPSNSGRPAGYLQDRLTELLVLADWCREHNRDVQWS